MAVRKKISGTEHRKREKQKKAAESELLKKVPKLNSQKKNRDNDGIFLAAR